MARPVLTRFDTFLYRDKSSTDNTQVPFAGALVEFFSQGATCSNDPSVTVPALSSGTTVSVYDTGQLKVGSTVQVGPGNAPLLTVVLILSGTQIVLSSDSPANVLINKGTRLYLISDRPALFDDPVGTTPRQGSYLIADDDGRVAAYVAATRYDYVVYDSAPVAPVAPASHSTISGGSTLSWTHSAGNGANLDASKTHAALGSRATMASKRRLT